MNNNALVQRLKSSKQKLGSDELLFKYSSYWRTWNRVLAPRGSLDLPYCEFTMVEVDLTPVNGWSSSHVKRVQAINIRKHSTADCTSDKYTTELPPDVLADMAVHLELEVVETLLHPALLDQIDWLQYRKHDNGGCPLELCRKVEYSEAV